MHHAHETVSPSSATSVFVVLLSWLVLVNIWLLRHMSRRATTCPNSRCGSEFNLPIELIQHFESESVDCFDLSRFNNRLEKACQIWFGE